MRRKNNRPKNQIVVPTMVRLDAGTSTALKTLAARLGVSSNALISDLLDVLVRDASGEGRTVKFGDVLTLNYVGRGCLAERMLPFKE